MICADSPIVRHGGTIRRMIPDRATHKPTPEYVRQLLARIGRTQVWVAGRTGISRRRIQYLLVGSKVYNGVTQEVKLNYPEQWVLECLAEAGDAFAKKP